ncbi:MAG: GGDEF domain-containing protein [Planctomycetota bacterium]
MTRPAHGVKEVIDVCVVLFASITFASTSIVLHMIDGLHALVVLCRNQPMTETLVNTIFLLFVVLLWITYRRWRRAQQTIEHLLHRDDLTGLYNRRSFIELAEQQLNQARQSRSSLALFFIDLDGMKQINDAFGHHEGDRALTEVADILNQSFGDESIIARLGGDEFVVLTVDPPMGSPEALLKRLRGNLDGWNGRQDRPYRLSVSTGVVWCQGRLPHSIEELLRGADSMLYAQKRVKNKKPAGASHDAFPKIVSERPRVMVEVGATTS